jgi:hypothetical protein
LLIGLALALAASALGAYALKYDLYGRELVGWYLLFLTLVWLAPAAWRRPPAWVWIGMLLAVHGYCLQLMAIRYF